MIAYDHDWEELEAEDQRAGIPVPTSPVLKEIVVSHFHSKKAYTSQWAENLEQHKEFLPILAAL